MSVDSFTLLHNFQWSNYIRIGKYTWNLCQPPPPIPLPYPSTQFLLLFFRRENGTSKTKIGQSLQNRQGVKTACSLNISGTKITTVSISYGTSGLSNVCTSVKVDSNGNLRPSGLKHVSFFFEFTAPVDCTVFRLAKRFLSLIFHIVIEQARFLAFWR